MDYLRVANVVLDSFSESETAKMVQFKKCCSSGPRICCGITNEETHRPCGLKGKKYHKQKVIKGNYIIFQKISDFHYFFNKLLWNVSHKLYLTLLVLLLVLVGRVLHMVMLIVIILGIIIPY